MAAIRALPLLAYPFLVYLALQVAEPRLVALVSLLLFGLRFAATSPRRLLATSRLLLLPGLAAIGASAASMLWNDALCLLFTPALMSLSLLLAFGLSFLQRETVVEGFARAQLGALPAEVSVYCRRLTMLWCAFFLGNGAISLQLALRGSRQTWALYTGLIAYLAMGTLFALEFAYRRWRFGRDAGAPAAMLI